jgi:hypothetical protein
MRVLLRLGRTHGIVIIGAVEIYSVRYATIGRQQIHTVMRDDCSLRPLQGRRPYQNGALAEGLKSIAGHRKRQFP